MPPAWTSATCPQSTLSPQRCNEAVHLPVLNVHPAKSQSAAAGSISECACLTDEFLVEPQSEALTLPLASTRDTRRSTFSDRSTLEAIKEASDSSMPLMNGSGSLDTMAVTNAVRSAEPSFGVPTTSAPCSSQPSAPSAAKELATLLQLAVADLRVTVEKKVFNVEALVKSLKADNAPDDAPSRLTSAQSLGPQVKRVDSKHRTAPPTVYAHGRWQPRGSPSAADTVTPDLRGSAAVKSFGLDGHDPTPPTSQATARVPPPSRNRAELVASELRNHFSKASLKTGSQEKNLVLVEDERARTTALTKAAENGTDLDKVAELKTKRREMPWIHRAVNSRAFETVFGLLIFTNSLLIAIEVQWKAQHLGETLPAGFALASHCYSIGFGLELVMRMLAASSWKRFFCGRDRAWAWMDTCIVAASFLEIVFDIMVAFTGGHKSDNLNNVTTFRIMRAVRVTRLMRTLRLQRLIRFVSALRTLIFSILVTLKSLVWAMVLLFMIIYVFAIALTQSAIDHLNDNELSASQAPVLVDFWGSLDTSMSSLFQSITGGVSWRDAIEPLHEVSYLVVWVFLCYIFFVYFAVLNVVTGVFCSSAIETAQHNPELVAHSLISNREQYVSNLRWLFEKVDDDASGFITINELETLLTDDMTRAYFKAMELDANDAWTLFKLIDKDGSGLVEIEEFIMGCEALRGSAKTLDVANMMYESRLLARKLFKFMVYCENQFEVLTGNPGVIGPQMDGKDKEIYAQSSTTLVDAAS